MFDVAIIGAGPAGTAAAWDLLEKGLKVLVLDKYQFPRKKACAGGITPKGLTLFRYDITSVIERTCNSINIIERDKKSFKVSSPMPLCYMTDRKNLDYFSLSKVIDKGALFSVIKQINAIEEKKDHVVIRTISDIFKARYLIGGDGANSRVRQLVSKSNFYKNCMAIEADIDVTRPDQYRMEFDFSRISRGYHWIFPKARSVNIGIYTTDKHHKLSTGKLKKYGEERVGSESLKNLKGYPICVNGFDLIPGSNRIFLAGDAGGMAEPLFGEGIYFALKTGQVAAKAILQSHTSGLPAKYLYIKFLKPILSDLKWHNLASRWFYRYPSFSLKTAAIPFIHRPFVEGYSKGKPLREILFSLVYLNRFSLKNSKL